MNGKKSFSLNAQNIYLVNADLYTLNGNKHFLKLKCQDIDNDHIDYDKLLTYKSGKLVSAVNLMSHRKGAFMLAIIVLLKKLVQITFNPYAVNARRSRFLFNIP